MPVVRRKQWATLAAVAVILSCGLALSAERPPGKPVAPNQNLPFPRAPAQQIPTAQPPAQRAPAGDSAATCGSHGKINRAGACTCNAGFAGANCNQCAPGHYAYPTCGAGANCSGHGSNDSAGNCVCNAGFTGASCNQCAPSRYGPQCSPCPSASGSVCSGNGICSDGVSGSGTCSCNAGYSGPACSTRVGG